MATAQLSTAHPAPLRTRRDLSALLGYLLISPPVLIMTLLIFFPIIQSVLRTLFVENASTGQAAFSFENYAKFFSNRVLTNNLWFTVTETVWTVVALFVIGFPLSLYLRFSKSRIAAAVQILALFPLFVPGIILAYALIQFLGSHGSLDTMLRNIGFTDYATPYLKWNGIVIALVWEHIPFTVLVLTAGFRQVENSVIESARDVGANGWQIFTRILLPLVQRSALIVFCLNVIGVFGAFTLPYLLGPAAPMMMGVSMQQTFNGYNDVQGAETQAVITFLICAAVGLLYVHTITRPRVERT